MRLAGILLAACAALVGMAAWGHATGSSYLTVDASAQGELDVRWDIPTIDLLGLLELDRDGDGRVVAVEIEARRALFARLAGANLVVRRGDRDCAVELTRAAAGERAGQPVVLLRLAGRCPVAGALELSTTLYFASPAYTALFEVTTPDGRYPGVLSARSNRWRQPESPDFLSTFSRFLVEGGWHVLIGYDHVAFLLLLLLPSVLRGARAGWLVATSRGEVVRDLLKIVTAFTLAHSVTLGLAATETVTLPARPVEVAIAASIVAAGVLNLFPAAARWRLPLAFGFGFVHGFGFANALGEIDGPGFRIAPMLAGFNLGVECAQLLIVAVALPLLLALARAPLYRRRLMPAMSLATAALGAFWLVSRV